MNALTFTKESEYSLANKSFLLFSAILLVPIILLLFSILGFTISKFLLFISIPFLLVSILSFETMLFLFIASLFINFTFQDIQIAVYLVYPLFLSYLITHNKFEISFSPLKLLFIVYFLSIVPSLFNSIDILKSIFYLQNLVAIYLVAFILHNYLNDLRKIKKLFLFLFLFCFSNALYTLITGILTGQRSWGFAGIAHVDYLSLFAFIFISISLIETGFKRFLSIIVFIIFFLSLIFTQTRSILLTFGISFMLIVLYLFINSKKYNLKKIRMFFLFLIALLIAAGVILTVSQINPQSFARVNELQSLNTEKIEYEADFSTNSIFTRLLIWHTAYKAFIEHPYIGIGIYSFPFSSEIYHELTPSLYKKVVEGLSPHVAYFAVLTETGLLGFTGFLFLLFFLLRLAYKNLKQSFSAEEKFYALISSFSMIYIVISMFITDAWLWGQCGLLWGITMGSLSGINKIIRHRVNHL